MEHPDCHRKVFAGNFESKEKGVIRNHYSGLNETVNVQCQSAVFHIEQLYYKFEVAAIGWKTL
jgi:hypothetical protein